MLWISGIVSKVKNFNKKSETSIKLENYWKKTGRRKGSKRLMKKFDTNAWKFESRFRTRFSVSHIWSTINNFLSSFRLQHHILSALQRITWKSHKLKAACEKAKAKRVSIFGWRSSSAHKLLASNYRCFLSIKYRAFIESHDSFIYVTCFQSRKEFYRESWSWNSMKNLESCLNGCASDQSLVFDDTLASYYNMTISHITDIIFWSFPPSRTEIRKNSTS